METKYLITYVLRDDQRYPHTLVETANSDPQALAIMRTVREKGAESIRLYMYDVDARLIEVPGASHV